jgi:hypothetical protein
MTQRVVNYKYGTGNPVLPDGSIDVRDGVDNLQSFDIFMNADEDTYNQRDGEIVKTRAGAVRAVGIQRVGDFTTGCTVTERNQGVLYETDGTVYVWLGALPKSVPAGSSPVTTGGLGPSGWLDIGDASAYSRLEPRVYEAMRRSYAEAGYNLVAGSFEAGGALVNANDVLLHEASGKAFSGSAGTVAAGTDPTSGGFVDRSTQMPYGRSDIRYYGAIQGIDNSVALALAVSEQKTIKVPSGAWGFSVFDIPAGTTIEMDDGAVLEITAANGLKFASSRYSKIISITTTGGKGSKTFTCANGSLFAPGDLIQVIFDDDVTDAYYISIAENPNEMGFQGQTMTVGSVSGNVIITKEPLLFNFKNGKSNSLRKVVREKTTIKGGTIRNSSSGWMHNAIADNVVLVGVKLDINNKYAMRFNQSFGVAVVRGSTERIADKGGLLFGYGVTYSGVVDTHFYGGVSPGDGQLITFAGTNNFVSQRNKFHGRDCLAGLYFGAKCYNMQSLSDKSTGGRYGLLAAFGAQRVDIISPTFDGFSLAGVFLERTQNAKVVNPRLISEILTAVDATVGGIAIKDCDTISIVSPEIKTSGARTMSVFNSPSNAGVVREDIHFIGGNLSGGDFVIECPIKREKIKDLTSEKSITSYFVNGFSEDAEVIGNTVTNGSLSLRSMRNANIERNVVDANGGNKAIELTGGTRFCKLRNNRAKNATYGYSVPNSAASQFTTAIYPDNEIDNCTNFIDNGVGYSASAKPSAGVAAPRNFFLPVTVFNATAAQTVSGYRSNGNGATNETAWVRVLQNEDLV